MAKFLSIVYSTISGKVGGLIYTKNQFAGLIVRAFVPPTNPGTTDQTIIRSAFDRASVEWQNLSQASRDAWSDYAATLTYEGPQGSYRLPGRQVFMSNISLAIYCEDQGYGSVVAGFTAPTIAGFLNIGTVKPVVFTGISDTGIAVSVENGTAEDVTCLVQRSFGFNPTRNVWRGPWVTSANVGLDVTTLTAAFQEFGGLNAASVYFTRVIAVSEQAPHRISAPFFLRHIPDTNGP